MKITVELKNGQTTTTEIEDETLAVIIVTEWSSGEPIDWIVVNPPKG